MFEIEKVYLKPNSNLIWFTFELVLKNKIKKGILSPSSVSARRPAFAVAHFSPAPACFTSFLRGPFLSQAAALPLLPAWAKAQLVGLPVRSRLTPLRAAP